MKNKIILRIVLYSILIILFIGLLIAGLMMSPRRLMRYMLRDSPSRHSFATSDRGEYTVSGSDSGNPHSGSVSSADISDLEIDWANGAITIEPGDTDTITFSESPDALDSMVWYVSDETLFIHFSDENMGFDFQPGKHTKDLTITVPRSWSPSEITLYTASCNLEISDLTILEELEIEGASNHSRLMNCSVDQISISGASNTFSMNGSLNHFESDDVSSVCTLVLSNQPKSITVSGVSSQLDLTLPKDCGFSGKMDGVSARLHTDFPIVGKNDQFSYGDGSCKIDIDGVSSELSIHKAA